jgi:hypothetical protein
MMTSNLFKKKNYRRKSKMNLNNLTILQPKELNVLKDSLISYKVNLKRIQEQPLGTDEDKQRIENSLSMIDQILDQLDSGTNKIQD